MCKLGFIISYKSLFEAAKMCGVLSTLCQVLRWWFIWFVSLMFWTKYFVIDEKTDLEQLIYSKS